MPLTKPAPVSEENLRAAFTNLLQGQLAAAEAGFVAILSSHPGHAEALHGLSRVMMAKGDAGQAIATARAAVAAAPARATLHYALGILLQDTRAYEEARDAYQTAVRLEPGFHQAWHNLGLVLRSCKLPEEAIEAFRHALTHRPDYAGALHQLGILLMEQGRHEEASRHLRGAVAQAPGNASFQASLGRALLSCRLPEAALHHLAKALDLEERRLGGRSPDHALYGLFGKALSQSCAHAFGPGTPPVPRQRALLLLGQLEQFSLFTNDWARAIEADEHIVRLDPGNWRARFGRRRSLPAIPASAESIDATRCRYAAGLDALLAEAGDDAIPRDKAKILEAVDADSLFYLAYQGGDDRPLQEKLSAVWTRLLGSVLPDCQTPLQLRSRPESRIRVGFAGIHFRRSTVGRYFCSWVTGLDPEVFDTRVFMLRQPVEDELTAEIRTKVDRCVQVEGELDEMARMLRAEELDILVYPELGMDNRCYALAALRLAPVQCAAWGHPVTSGHRTIDYYFTSEWMEPAGAQEHYAENLVLLPGIGTCYRPEKPDGGLTRADFGLPADGALFFYPHSLFKIHPDNDELVAKVLAAVPGSRLLLVSRENPWVTRAFLDRVGGTWDRLGLSRDRLIVLGGLSQGRYLALAALCDALLDTLHWSGGNTTLDSLTVGLPIVTQWGRFMRGRQSAAMLHAMGMDELIAADHETFVGIARRLAVEPSWRAAVSARLLAQHDRVFSDSRPVHALAGFLKQVAGR